MGGEKHMKTWGQTEKLI